jgi:hypothetical protein
MPKDIAWSTVTRRRFPRKVFGPRTEARGTASRQPSVRESNVLRLFPVSLKARSSPRATKRDFTKLGARDGEQRLSAPEADEEWHGVADQITRVGSIEATSTPAGAS